MSGIPERIAAVITLPLPTLVSALRGAIKYTNVDAMSEALDELYGMAGEMEIDLPERGPGEHLDWLRSRNEPSWDDRPAYTLPEHLASGRENMAWDRWNERCWAAQDEAEAEWRGFWSKWLLELLCERRIAA